MNPLQSPTSRATHEIIQEESAIISVVKNSSPSVVAVSAVSQRPQIQFFGPFRIEQPGGGASQEQSIGTGFVVANNGLIVTNKHVVADANTKYVVVTSDEKKYDVKNVFRDPDNDLAILKIDANLTTAQFR